MENRMDRQSQPLGSRQAPSSESELPSSPVLSQEPLTASPDLRLFKRITRWTLLLGIMVGCGLTLFGIEMFGTQLHISLSIEAQLIGPLMFVSMGIVFILQWRVQLLPSQLPAFRQNPNGTFQPFNGLLGFAFIGIGAFSLLAPHLPPDIAMPMIEYGGLGLLILIGSLNLYFTARSNRQAKRK